MRGEELQAKAPDLTRLYEEEIRQVLQGALAAKGGINEE